MKAIFDVREKSGYEDELPEHYHFPNKYLQDVEKTIGDWVIFRTPRAGGGDKAYFALGKVEKTGNRPGKKGHFAYLEEYLTFPNKVRWRENGIYQEEQLRKLPAAAVGRSLRGASVRSISDFDFSAIITAGFGDALHESGFDAEYLNVQPDPSASDHQPIQNFERRIETVVKNKKIRAASFRTAVLVAYDNRCAITGIRLVDEKNKAEAQAAHIWSVEHGGPDVVQNGIALSGTAHWLLDRGWIDISDRLGITIKKKGIPKEILTLIKAQRSRIILPSDKNEWPHPFYLQKRREQLAS